MTQSAQREWFEQILAGNNQAEQDDRPSVFTETRQQARELLGDLPLPHRKQEAWRYTDFMRLFEQDYQPQLTPVTGVSQEDIETWIYSASESYRLVFVNGLCVPELSNLENLHDDIKIGSLRAMMSTDAALVSAMLNQQAEQHQDVFTALNIASLMDGLFIHIGKDIDVQKPVEIVHLNINFEGRTLSQPHSLIVLEQGASLKVVERYMSTGQGEYLFNGVSDVVVGERARLQHICLQHESMKAYHLNRVQVTQAGESDYRAMHVTSGGAWSRSAVGVRFTGTHAQCALRGVYTTGSQQYTDYHLDVQHAYPNCISREDFRGIVYGEGRAVFDGRIVVHEDAQGSDARLSNKNLLLCENAEIDTKPQLEIYADDVKCAHGTTVGRLDPEQVFYLRSRGISEQQARNMLCLGFAEQILATIDDESVYNFILADITERLQMENQSL